MADAEQTEKEIDLTRSQYIPVAVRTQLLFFCTTDLVIRERERERERAIQYFSMHVHGMNITLDYYNFSYPHNTL